MMMLTHIKKAADGWFFGEQQLICVDGTLQGPTQISPMHEDCLLAWLYLRAVDTGYAFRRRLQDLTKALLSDYL